MADPYDDVDSSFKLQEDAVEFESALSREELIRDELSGSVSILPSNGVTSKDKKTRRRCSYCVLIGVTVFVFLLGLIVLIVGIVLISKKPSCERSKYDAYTNMCKSSSEAKDSGFYDILDKVQTLYYETFPNKIAYKRPVSVEEIRQKFRIYDESPTAKKNFTDKSKALLKEVDSLKIDRMKLSLRESKALSQVVHVLKYGLGYTYSTNYYTGDYMLLPNLWCAMVPICDIGHDLGSGLRYLKPNTVEDLEVLRDRLKTVQAAFNQMVENLRYGIRAGMVPTVEACHAGINGLREGYIHIADGDERGVFKEPYMKDVLDGKFLSNITANTYELNRWKEKYGKSVNESLREYILEFVGKPIDGLFRYIRGEYLTHCVPSNISSGLASLPLDYVYTNGTADTSKQTTKRLPTGEVLDGKKTYSLLVGSYTTNDMSPDEIYKLGVEMTDKLYPQVVDIAKKITGEADNETAIASLLKKLNSSEMYYNKDPFPANESDENAYKRCSNVKDARKHCPVRWETIERCFAETSMFNSLLDPKTVSMFYFTGPKYSVPNCPLALMPDFNPSAAVPSYREGGPYCLETAKFRLPFFGKKMGPKWLMVSFCGHEGRPGHHTQLQGYLERFRDTCGGVITWLDKLALYWGFLEGWGLYAENPLVALETDLYKTRPLAKYGMLYAQISRSLRLILDVGLHYKGMTRSQASDVIFKYTWSKSSQSAITRYQSAFGQATTYTIGQRNILKLREHAKKELGSKFKLQDFHFHMLSQGNSPLSHFDEVIEQYITCTKDKTQTGCDVILNPPIRPEGAGDDEGVQDDREFYFDPPQPPKRTFYH